MPSKAKKYDIVVVGAGIAGIVAAVTAARRGCRVALLEKQTLIGGLATAGLVYIYLPLCDGNGRQVTFGMADELFSLSLRYSPFQKPTGWDSGGENASRLQVNFSPAGLILSLDKLLLDAQVDVWLDTRVCDVNTMHEGIESLVVENASGKITIAASCFIDASGDAFIVRHAGGKVFSSKNLQTPWFLEYDAKCENNSFLGPLNVHTKLVGDSLDFQQALEGKATTQFVRSAWQLIRDYYDEKYQHSSRADNFPLQLPSMPQFRKMAAIDSLSNMDSCQHGQYRNDSIGIVADWRRRGILWETSYYSLLPKITHRVITAGRCIGAHNDAWEAFRSIPASALTGEAAGICATLSVQQNIPPHQVPLADVQKEMRTHGNILHISELQNAETP